jgi:hypothetical protein
MPFDRNLTMQLVESLERNLADMSYDDYLDAMLHICWKLREAYARLFSPVETGLIERSLDVLVLAVQGGPRVELALPVSLAWESYLSKPGDGGPSRPALLTFKWLIGELAGRMRPRSGIDWLPNAATELQDADTSREEVELVQVFPFTPPAGKRSEKLLLDIEEIARLAREGNLSNK